MRKIGCGLERVGIHRYERMTMQEERNRFNGYLAYIDKIDILTYANKTRRIVTQIRDLCAIIAGLLVAGDYKLGNQLFSESSPKQNELFYQQIFEVGRRLVSYDVIIWHMFTQLFPDTRS